ncbi:iron-sulfur cluster biosynthesis family protein [Neobacillus terrae]|uniref:iron-sulfur cluster biosynthesis family protein n=1 Tax=Neobacillus terrae TaxID=3034837 RepID=UPI00140CE69E|nr:iron-sulfur cluster biosynthesis family protein [Neobacillus terrae]NHM33869.1 iron-sulfur cluster biosynthesis family protein [Neobacillus terrae]
MEIVIKPNALEELKKLEFKKEEGFRIEAIFVGSCSIYANHHLKVDQKRPDDDLFIVEDIPVLISLESQKHLSNKLTLDYNPKFGYKLSSNEEIYSFNLKIEK